MKKNIWFLPASGIVLLCVAFVIVSCGTGPQEKVLVLGKYSADFSKGADAIAHAEDTPSDAKPGTLASSVNMTDKEITLEAWVKKPDGAAGTLTGIVFARMSTGVALVVKDDVPEFGLARPGGSTTHIVVPCTSDISDNQWHHIVGKLTTEQHGGADPASCQASGIGGPVGNETPHLECIMDGVLEGCKSSGENYVEDSNANEFHIGSFPDISGEEIDGVKYDNNNAAFKGLIDDVRFWLEARDMDTEIIPCKDGNLGSSGTCSIGQTLVGYWRFDEGSGTSSTDSSGTGYAVSLMNPFGYEWSGGWSTDTPF